MNSVTGTAVNRPWAMWLWGLGGREASVVLGFCLSLSVASASWPVTFTNASHSLPVLHTFDGKGWLVCTVFEYSLPPGQSGSVSLRAGLLQKDRILCHISKWFIFLSSCQEHKEIFLHSLWWEPGRPGRGKTHKTARLPYWRDPHGIFNSDLSRLSLINYIHSSINRSGFPIEALVPPGISALVCSDCLNLSVWF